MDDKEQSNCVTSMYLRNAGVSLGNQLVTYCYEIVIVIYVNIINIHIVIIIILLMNLIYLQSCAFSVESSRANYSDDLNATFCADFKPGAHFSNICRTLFFFH